MQHLDAFLPTLTLAAPASAGDLTVFPLLRIPAPDPWYDTLGEAVAAGAACVTEISDAGRVPELRVVNQGARPVLIVDGEELVGAKQNRIVNLTILVPAKTTIAIPVSCVEAGRWRQESHEFAPADRAYHASGRRAKVAQVTMSMHTESGHQSDQGAIWAEIDSKSARLGASSRTRAAAAMYEQQGEALDRFVASLEPLDGQVGAVFAIRGQIAGLDVFDVPRTWARLMPKLVRSYGLDALDLAISGDGFAQPDARRFLDAVCRAHCSVFPAVGAGRDLRVEGHGVVGAALAAEGGIVHAVAFPAAHVERPSSRRMWGRG